MAKVTPAEANEYLLSVGQWHVPVMDDDEWVKTIGFLIASGFIKDADYSSPTGQIMLTIIGTVWDQYQEWNDSLAEDALPDIEA